VLRRFGLNSDDLLGEWRKLHNEKLRDLYSSTSRNRMMKSLRMRYAGHGGVDVRIIVMGGKARGKEVTIKTET
jgi:hypothetical protein